MNEKILQLINDAHPEEPKYTGFTIFAHNSEGVRLIQHHISTIDQIMQVMVLMKEVRKDMDNDEPSWQYRVIQERVDLEYALRRLNKFIRSDKFDEILDFEQELLLEQRKVMEEYYRILGERICSFEE